MRTFKFFTVAARTLLMPSVSVWVLYQIFKTIYLFTTGESFGINMLDVVLSFTMDLALACYAVAGMTLIEEYYNEIKRKENED